MYTFVWIVFTFFGIFHVQFRFKESKLKPNDNLMVTKKNATQYQPKNRPRIFCSKKPICELFEQMHIYNLNFSLFFAIDFQCHVTHKNKCFCSRKQHKKNLPCRGVAFLPWQRPMHYPQFHFLFTLTTGLKKIKNNYIRVCIRDADLKKKKEEKFR